MCFKVCVPNIFKCARHFSFFSENEMWEKVKQIETVYSDRPSLIFFPFPTLIHFNSIQNTVFVPGGATDN